MHYSLTDFITNLRNEYRIVSHLASQITDTAMLDHRFSPAQRSVRELLQYLVCGPVYQIKLMKYGTADFVAHDVDHTNFVAHVADHLGAIEKELADMTDAQLAETVILRGGAYAGTRTHFLLHSFLPQFVAYKMQLFLQLKHAGLTQLATPDIWMGVSKK